MSLHMQDDQPLWLPVGSGRLILALMAMGYGCYVGSMEIIFTALGAYGILGENSPLRGKS